MRTRSLSTHLAGFFPFQGNESYLTRWFDYSHHRSLFFRKDIPIPARRSFLKAHSAQKICAWQCRERFILTLAFEGLFSWEENSCKMIFLTTICLPRLWIPQKCAADPPPSQESLRATSEVPLPRLPVPGRGRLFYLVSKTSWKIYG